MEARGDCQSRGENRLHASTGSDVETQRATREFAIKMLAGRVPAKAQGGLKTPLRMGPNTVSSFDSTL